MGGQPMVCSKRVLRRRTGIDKHPPFLKRTGNERRSGAGPAFDEWDGLTAPCLLLSLTVPWGTSAGDFFDANTIRKCKGSHFGRTSPSESHLERSRLVALQMKQQDAPTATPLRS